MTKSSTGFPASGRSVTATCCPSTAGRLSTAITVIPRSRSRWRRSRQGSGSHRGHASNVDCLHRRCPRGQRSSASDESHQRLRRAARLRIIRGYGGHGIGTEMHENPWIPNNVADFDSVNRRGLRRFRLRPGMTIALEPMLTLGDWQTVVEDDDWTVSTQRREYVGALGTHPSL